MDDESYQQITRCIGILKILAKGEKEILQERTVDNETVFEEIRKKLLNTE